MLTAALISVGALVVVVGLLSIEVQQLNATNKELKSYAGLLWEQVQRKKV